MRTGTALLAGVLVALVAVPVAAKTRCGSQIFSIDDTRRAYLGNFVALCDGKGACKSATYVNDTAQPSQWTHRLAFLRAAKDAPWTVQLTSVPNRADTTEGFDLGIDDKEPMRVPAEVISSPGSINDYNLNPDLGQIVLTSFGPAANAKWLYTAKDGGGPQEVWFSLKGLKSSIQWIDCMQKR